MPLPEIYVPLLPKYRHLHKCIDCGFLGSKVWMGDLREVTRSRRNLESLQASVDCFKDAFNLDEEVSAVYVAPAAVRRIPVPEIRPDATGDQRAQLLAERSELINKNRAIEAAQNDL